MSLTVTQAVEQLIRATVRLSDEDMGREWTWGAYDEEGLRFALLMTHHELRDLAVRLASRRVAEPSESQRILAQYHQAYRDLTGVLAGVTTEDLDTVPAAGEWPLRETLKHIIGAEHGFLAVCRFGIERSRSNQAGEPSDAEWESFRAPYAEARTKAEEAVSTGTIDAIRDAFATIHIRVLRELRDVTEPELEAPAWFWDGAMPIRFRLHRFEAHLRQHTIQLDKIRAAVLPPTEAQRLVRNVYNALADVETDVSGREDLREATAKVIVERARGILG